MPIKKVEKPSQSFKKAYLLIVGVIYFCPPQLTQAQSQSCMQSSVTVANGTSCGAIFAASSIVVNVGGTIQPVAGQNAVSVPGLMSTLDNSGLITDTYSSSFAPNSINVGPQGMLNILTNNVTGVIGNSADTNYAIYVNGAVNSLSNSGTIYGIKLSSGYSLANITNNVGGIIYSPFNGGISNVGIVIYGGNVAGGISNSGQINGLALYGASLPLIQNSSSGAITSLSASGIAVETVTLTSNQSVSTSSSSLTTLNNQGVIASLATSPSNANSAISGVMVSGANSALSNVSNSGQIYGEIGVSVRSGLIGEIDNSGLLQSTSTVSGVGAVLIGGGAGSSIGSITNSGTIIASAGGNYGVLNKNTAGSLSTLNNLQGVGTNYSPIGGGPSISSGPLTYSGALPTNYNIIVRSQTQFGQLSYLPSTSALSGSMAFNIYGNTGTTLTAGVPASTLGIGTYADVLQGLVGNLSGGTISGSNFSITGTSGTYGGLYYSLVPDSAQSGYWNLSVNSSPPSAPSTPSTTNILPNQANLLSAVGSSLNPVLDGGVLKIDSAGTSSAAFAITANNGKIDQNGLTSNFTGNITDSNVGVHGKLAIINSGSGGSVILSGNNTYSGGTEVDAGANLSISSANNIGTGALALVGTSTTPATLTTIANMTISNPITVTGDPVFYVVSGTTTTVSSPITDGGSSGDVVVSGGGTLALTAANTYTGLTNINAGSTLALVGAGSITNSSALNNSGTVDVRGANGNVVLGGTFTQTSTGNLLMNISPTNNQQLNVTGAAALAGGLSLNATAGTYAAGKYTLLTANGVTGIFGTFASNLSSYTRLGYALGYDANDVYLYLTPNVADSQQSLVNSASALQNIYTLQNTVLANSFSYDCNVFGENDVCVSAGGRNTAVSAANGLNNTSALLIASYRLDESNSRVGAYADQNLSMNQAGNTVNLGNNTPLMGLFAAWNENADGTGTEVKAGIAYGQKNASVTRQVVGTSEPGTGSSQLNSQGAQITAKYGFALDEQIIVSPYIGMRYTKNNMGGYTEATSAAVTSPLTYAALNANATTALAGLGASYRFIPEVTLFASAGVETDTNTANGTYSATGVSGLTPINFNVNPVKTRPTAMLGASYDVEKNQRIGITGIYRQEAFQAVSTTSVMATYTVGF